MSKTSSRLISLKTYLVQDIVHYTLEKRLQNKGSNEIAGIQFIKNRGERFASPASYCISL